MVPTGNCVKCGKTMPYNGICFSCLFLKEASAAKNKPAREQQHETPTDYEQGKNKHHYNKPVPNFFSKKRYRLAVDIDGVFLNTNEAWMKKYCRDTGKPPFSIKRRHFAEEAGINEKEFYRIYDEIDPADVGLMDANGPIILGWLGTFVDVFFLTGKTDKMMEWNSIVLERYSSVPVVKWSSAKWECEFDLIVDDSPDVIDGCLTRGKDALLYYNETNGKYADEKGVEVVFDWSDIVKKVLDRFGIWICENMNEEIRGDKP